MTGEGPPSNVPPAAFGRFRVLHQIGAGSLGPVFRAEDPASQTSVVIKVLRLNLTPERARIVADELAALQDRVPAHPGIAPIVKAGIRDVEPFVVSAFMPGDSLDVALREFGPSPVTEALPRLVQVAAGLDFCADASIWHGGLHPRDVLVSATETAIVGVGIASILEQVGVKLPVRRPYTAPEVIDGLVTSPASDQYSLAAMAFEWLYGRRIVGPAEGRIEVPEVAGVDRTAMAEAFTSALAMDPAVRFESSSAFIAALADAMEKTEATSRPPMPIRISSPRPPATLTSIVTPLPDPRVAAALDDGAAAMLHERAVGTSSRMLDDLELADRAPDTRRVPRAVTAVDPPASRLPVRWVSIGAALAAAIVVSSAAGYWLGLRPFADASSGRPPVSTSDASAAATTAPLRAPASTAASLTGATPSADPTPPREAPPEVVPAPPIPGEPPAAGQSTEQAGRVLVRSSPAGADVLVNGERRGVTPLALRELPFGPYSISVSRVGYSDQQHQVTLSAARPSQSLEITLVGGAGVSGGSVTSSTIAAPGATIGSLMIESRPVGVTVSIDGRAAGITPIMLERLAPGAHAVRLERTGYQPWTTTVNVVAGELTRLAASLAGGQEQE